MATSAMAGGTGRVGGAKLEAGRARHGPGAGRGGPSTAPLGGGGGWAAGGREGLGGGRVGGGVLGVPGTALALRAARDARRAWRRGGKGSGGLEGPCLARPTTAIESDRTWQWEDVHGRLGTDDGAWTTSQAGAPGVSKLGRAALGCEPGAASPPAIAPPSGPPNSMEAPGIGAASARRTARAARGGATCGPHNPEGPLGSHLPLHMGRSRCAKHSKHPRDVRPPPPPAAARHSPFDDQRGLVVLDGHDVLLAQVVSPGHTLGLAHFLEGSEGHHRDAVQTLSVGTGGCLPGPLPQWRSHGAGAFPGHTLRRAHFGSAGALVAARLLPPGAWCWPTPSRAEGGPFVLQGAP